jgi:hypothetical protein
LSRRLPLCRAWRCAAGAGACESLTGEQISLARPAMTEDMEAEVREMLREILDEEGGV